VRDIPIAFSTVRLPDPPPGWFDYDYTVLVDGRLALVRAECDLLAETRKWWERGREGASRAPAFGDVRGRLSDFDGEREGDVVEVALGDYPHVDRLADGRWIIAAGRSEQGQQNARIINQDGSLAAKIIIGDGIAHLASASEGTFWVGYFDEGIFGGAEGTMPPGAAGIAHFSADGSVNWRANEGDRWFVHDCYALCVAGSDMWACVYSDFPILRVREGRLTKWRNPIEGPHAIAAFGDYALLAGCYGEPDRLTLLKLGDGHATVMAQARLPARERWIPSLVAGRDDTIHVVVDGLWHRISVGNFLAAING